MSRLYVIFLIILISSCGFNIHNVHKIKSAKQSQSNLSSETSEIVRDSVVAITVEDSLREVIYEKDIEISYLYSYIDSLNNKIDSLEVELDYANKRVAVNKDFVIPDSIIFAGRKFDLTNERTRDKFTKIYNQELKWAHIFLSRSGRYFPVFEKVFLQYNIPEDVKYLAVAESGLNNLAGSNVGAVGMWQFMKKTAKGYGLKINEFVDERRHPIKSTEAAAKYLLNAKQYLNNKGLNDWLLNIAAYNAGVGAVSRVALQQGGTDFFDLIMRADETNKYVWRAVAIKMIFENEEKIYGKTFEREPSFYDTYKLVDLELKGYYKIDDWAIAQGTTLGRIWELNPWINIFKRSRGKYSAINDVVLPPGKYQVIIPKDAVANENDIAMISKKFQKKNSGYFTYHIVKKGEYLGLIAKKYKISVKKLKQLNNLTSDIIRPGQKLRLIGNPNAGNGKEYVVKKGDTLWEIAVKNKTSVNKIKKLNNLQSNNIRPGQKLRVY